MSPSRVERVGRSAGIVVAVLALAFAPFVLIAGLAVLLGFGVGMAILVVRWVAG